MSGAKNEPKDESKKDPPTGLTDANSFVCPYCFHRNLKKALRCWFCSEDFYGPDGIHGPGA